MRLRGCRSLTWDRCHPLAYAEHLRLPAGDVLEQRVQYRQALVPRPDVIATVVLEVTEEAEDTLEAQVIDGELGDLRSLVLGYKAQEEADRVPVAPH